MKQKASLILMEQLVLLAVFALAGALCLGVFARAELLSRETDRRDRAVDLARTGAETLKAHAGDPQSTADSLGGSCSGDTVELVRQELTLQIRILPTRIPGLGEARISVYQPDSDEPLLSLTAAWQEVEP